VPEPAAVVAGLAAAVVAGLESALGFGAAGVAGDLAAEATGAATDLAAEVTGAATDLIVDAMGAVAVGAVDGGGVAACACRANISKRTKIPKAKIATCAVRRAMWRKIGWDIATPAPSGGPDLTIPSTFSA